MNRYNPIILAKIGSLDLSNIDNPLTMTLRHLEKANGGKEVEIIIENINLELIDHPDIQEGSQVEWMFGYPDEMSDKYSGMVTTINPTFDADSGMTLAIICNDAVAEMLQKKRQKVWKQTDESTAQITESDVVKRIADDLGLQPDIEETKLQYSQLSQNDYDWDYIQKLAETSVPKNPGIQAPYVAKIDEQNKVLHFKPMSIGGDISRTYRFFLEIENPTLLKFEPRTKTNNPDDTGNVGSVVKTVNPNATIEGSSDPSFGGDIESLLGGGNTNTSTGSSTPPVVANTANNETNTNRLGTGRYTINPVTGEFTPVAETSNETKETENLAGEQLADPSTQDMLFNVDNSIGVSENTHQASEMDQVEAEIELIGDPLLKANEMIQILNVGKKFSGAYYTHQVTHEISGSGFITKAELRRNAIPISENDVVSEEFKGQPVNETPLAADNAQSQEAASEAAETSNSQGMFDPITGEFTPPKGGK